ncbi:MAG: HAD-IA family hydrolase, partial [Planctomycetota bacterium]
FRPAAFVFDFDGLIANTEDIFELALGEVLARRGKTYPPEVRRQMMGRRAPEATAILIDALGLDDDPQALMLEGRETFLGLLDARLAPMPGLFALLDAVEHAGLPKTVATSSHREYLDGCLRKLGIDDRFAVTLTAEDVTHGKPDPEIYLAAADRLGVAVDRTVVLEDSEIGVEAAAAAGACAVAVPSRHSDGHGFEGATFIASSLSDPRILNLLGGPAAPRPDRAATRIPQSASLSPSTPAEESIRSKKPKRRVYDAERSVHFLTFSCYHRRQYLKHDHPRRIVLGQLGRRLHDRDGLCLGFVLMPNHVHAMVWFPEPGELSEFMNVWKTETSQAIRRYFDEHAPTYLEEVDDTGIWQPRYYDFSVLTRDKAEEKLDYMHVNPVRAGLAERPTDWAWSSARWYESGKPVGVAIGWPDGFD